MRYPLMIVHDGADYLHYTAARTVLDNLIHRGEVAEMVVAFISPGNRLVEYANHAPHARFVGSEADAVPPRTLHPLVPTPGGRTLMGSSFGGVAAVSTAAHSPRPVRIAVLESASPVFTDIGAQPRGGPVFDPVVEFVNAYRAQPRPDRRSGSSRPAACTSR